MSSNAPFLSSAFVAPVVAAPASSTGTTSKSEAEPEAEVAHPVEEEDEDEEDVLEPEIDEKQMAYSTMEGVKLLTQPTILKAELHEHQVSLSTSICDLGSSLTLSLHLRLLF